MAQPSPPGPRRSVIPERGSEPAALIERIKDAAQEETGIRALFLAGSHGRGTADAFSDVDFLAVAAPDDHEAVALAWRRILDGLAEIVFWSTWGSRARILLPSRATGSDATSSS